ncbi:MAG: VWA domain-containing protein [Eubacterium sp.]|nr:VWA domain-containing protein [Eubacterium sp.]
MAFHTYIHICENKTTKDYDLDSYKKDKIIIGRKADCDIIVKNAHVSGYHGCFFKENDKWLYQDLNSSNGSFLNDKKIITTELDDNIVIRIGTLDNNVLVKVTDESKRIPLLHKEKKEKKDGYNKLILFLSVALGMVAIAILGIILFKKEDSKSGGGGGSVSSGKLYGDVRALIDKECLEYIEEFELYCVPEDFSGFKGTFEGDKSDFESVSFTIEDAYGVIVFEGDISFEEEEWSIPEPAMMMGENTLIVKAVNKGGVESSDQITFTNGYEEYLENVNIDLEDRDDDGLIAYIETCIGTDDNNPDTDGDGLSDYVEYLMTGTDPTKYDTLEDGICDADRDSDDDGLTNRFEVDAETDPGVADTDGDGLSDGDEVNTYKTDPLLADTDSDEATDCWEIENGSNPLENDNSFEVYVEAGTIDMPVMAAIRADYEGNPECVCIREADNNVLMSQEMVGYIGSPYQLEFGSKVNDATLTMKYNPDCLTNGDDVAIYELDEETQLLFEIESSKTEDFTVTAKVDHAANYVLLDKTKIEESLNVDIKTEDDLAKIVTKVAFVIDYSKSMDDNDPNYERINIVRNYLGNLRNGKDEVSIIKFARYATTLVSMTTDIDQCTNAIGNIVNNDGTSNGCEGNNEAGTNGSDGLRKALDEFEYNDEKNDMCRAIVFLTDGEDTVASYDYNELVEEAVAKHVSVYSISLGDAEEETLRMLSEKTGGTFYRASEISDDDPKLVDVFDKIQGETIPDTDTNGDGINDYYTKKICDGKLLSGTGKKPFGKYTYDEVNSNSDLDGDGLLNGEEIVITELNGRVYVKMVSSPIEVDSDMDGYDDKSDNRPMKWDVGDRDLAIFASLSYCDGSDFKKSMYTEDDINKQSENELSGSFYKYASLSSVDKGICEKWIIDDYIVEDLTDKEQFSVTIYKCQNNVVLSYRGSGAFEKEFDEWMDNILGYGVRNCHGEEIYARKVARDVANSYPNCNIYITGHSLGGYLAQIGASEMLAETDVIPAGVVYFDGMGINFTDNSGIMDYIDKYAELSNNEDWQKLREDGEQQRLLHLKDIENLKEYYKDGNKLVLYNVYGDIVSALGKHYGDIISYKPPDEYAISIHNNNKNTDDLSKTQKYIIMKMADEITDEKIYKYYKEYKEKYEIESLFEYLELTHSRPSFYYYLHQGNRKP